MLNTNGYLHIAKNVFVLATQLSNCPTVQVWKPIGSVANDCRNGASSGGVESVMQNKQNSAQAEDNLEVNPQPAVCEDRPKYSAASRLGEDNHSSIAEENDTPLPSVFAVDNPEWLALLANTKTERKSKQNKKKKKGVALPTRKSSRFL